MPDNPLFDKNFINAFVKSVVETLKVMASTEPIPEPIKVERNYHPAGDVAGFIGMVSNDVRGNLTFTFEKEALFFVLNNMFGETYTEVTSEAADAVGEFTNMIYGNAKTTLNQLGYNLSMALPTVITGRFKISEAHSGATLVAPFKVGPGYLYVEITVDQIK